MKRYTDCTNRLPPPSDVAGAPPDGGMFCRGRGGLVVVLDWPRLPGPRRFRGGATGAGKVRVGQSAGRPALLFYLRSPCCCLAVFILSWYPLPGLMALGRRIWGLHATQICPQGKLVGKVGPRGRLPYLFFSRTAISNNRSALCVAERGLIAFTFIV